MLQKLAAGVSAVVLGACSVVGVRSGTEEPAFESLARFGDIEIRRYAPRLAAETMVEADETASRNEGFNRLARYIFGGNSGEQRIAMTAPVAQEPTRIAMTAPVAQLPQAGGGFRIRFFLPAALRTPPVPLDDRVRIVTVPAETVAVLRYAGSTGPEAVAAARRRLFAELPATRWRVAGEPFSWFYDPPWTLPPLRRNEIAVAVQAAD
ncbi:SOUL family heme-binding protein [Plastoroseomonas arctica]|uniref:Heme-binding protein n=1 Tax=Plastoroseomonas arctica TaxID=1509237 RepID=A0AAF1K2R8_9PROT|nr:heme-binding protein [Plastoroseomonas arctica]MBR0655728.1 heme-binding protein [Plastoroseomonas arctica]